MILDTLRRFFLNENKDKLISIKNQRRVLGGIAIALPLVCILGGLAFGVPEVQFSVSHYYHTNMQDFLVGILAAVAIFLLTYRGYQTIDDIVTSAIGLCAIGIILFPCPINPGAPGQFSSVRILPDASALAQCLTPCLAQPGLSVGEAAKGLGILQVDPGVSATAHIIATFVFFTLLAVNSLFLFTRTDVKKKKGQKKVELPRLKRWRNRIYIACGLIILACLIVISLLFLFANQLVATTIVGLSAEWLMLAAFGVSWLVKGETLFRDPAAAAKVKKA